MPLDEETRRKLVEAARQARQQAYAPYSGYQVGAALLAADGTIITGCNVENIAFGPSICAERTAVVKAVSEGIRQFEAVAVVTRDAISPCGVCRQVLAEFAPTLTVIMADADGVIHAEAPLDAMFTHQFGPQQIEIKPQRP